MHLLLQEIRHNPLLWLLVCVPAVFVVHTLSADAHTLLFLLSILAIVPLAALLSHATESVAAETGDTVGGLLNATLGNLTELVIALTRAWRCWGYVTNSGRMTCIIPPPPEPEEHPHACHIAARHLRRGWP
jgi:hypothetical protein